MKKLMAFICATVLAFSLVSVFTVASAEETYVGPSYFDDFESYSVFGEEGYDPMQLKPNWGNGYFDGIPGEEEKQDAACIPYDGERWKIVNEPTEENSNNKAMYLNFVPRQDSFTYFSLKDENGNLIKAKNFEVSFDFKLKQGLASNGWLGFAIRKSVDTRYNGCNNLMYTTRYWSDKAISLFAFRNIGMSGVDLSEKVRNEAHEEGSTGTAYSCENIYDTWYNFKVVANGTWADMYVNDTHIGGVEVTAKSNQKHGYISIVGCLVEVYIDNVKMTNNDTEAPPVEEDSSGSNTGDNPTTPEVVAPEVTGNKEISLTVGATNAVEVEVDLKGSEITKVVKDGVELQSAYYTYAEGKLTLTKEYITNLANKVGTYNYVITTAGGEATFTVTVKAETTGSSGCNGAIGSFGVLSIASLMGLLLIGKKRK